MRLQSSFSALFFLCGSVPLWLTNAVAVDHNNLDAGRPLEFDDAQSVAYREQAVEMGAAVAKPHHGKAGFEGSVEYLYGFAKNSHLSIDLDPAWMAAENGPRRFNRGSIGMGIFHNFNREYGNVPALALRADAYLPTGRGAEGVDFRLRGIASRQFGARGRLHLNVDAFFNNGASRAERGFRPGVILGYSRPLGYPTRFDRTLLLQIGGKANSEKGESAVVTAGIGLRQQVGVQAVVDLGLLSDLRGGGAREKWKLTAGYSRQF